MLKSLQKIGNSQGIILDKPLLDLLEIDKKDGKFEITVEKDGFFLKPVNIQNVYKRISKKHRKSLDKLGK